MKTPDLTRLAVLGTTIDVKVTPKAARNSLVEGPDGIRILVTAAPEDGKATAAAQALLAKALGIPKSRLELLRGATSRAKVFRVG